MMDASQIGNRVWSYDGVHDRALRLRLADEVQSLH